ncbi:hypothetical protein M0805_007039 [Coniferiporia weirii]|nr:hypothetical protein M0805_007039 [Coniferiporia weirii]
MPYAGPPASPEAASYDLPPLKLRSKHRRVRSATAFSDEHGPGAFAPLSNLPRRKSSSGDRRTLFHFNDQDSDSSDDAPNDDPNALHLTVDTKNLSVAPTPKESSLPFPSRGSPLPPSPSTPYTASTLPRTPSTPIILSNGKPLKPSLKSSFSSPHVPSLRLHARVQSEPATPNGTKNVHFAGDDTLRSVKLFNSSGKPVNVSRANSDETETETEYDSSNPAAEQNGYPFPSLASSAAPEETGFELDSKLSSQIPTVGPPSYANVHMETLILPQTGSPLMRGSIVVRNVAFAKEVAVRFTFDDWHTTSEIACKHVVSLPSLPPPFPTPRTPGDIAASATASTWDRFSFVIRLEDFARKLNEKTMWLVVRYTSPGLGEWWDNNSGQNYRVCFKKTGKPAGAPARESPRLSPVMGNSQQRTFSAPPTLKGTPTTEAVQTVAHGTQVPSAKFNLPSMHLRHHRPSMSAHSVSPPLRHNSFPQPTLPSAGAGRSTDVMYASAPSKLNLLNYAAPPRLPTLDVDSKRQHQASLSMKQMNFVNGMPASAPRMDATWLPSVDSTQSLANSTPPPSYTALPMPSDSEKQRAKEFVSSPTSTSDSSYAAFVKQWCFVQSPTPSPNQQPLLSGGEDALREAPQTVGNAWRGMGLDAFGGLYGNGMRSDSPMLASM